jgi:two-component system NtrC family sensor kinase
MSEQPIPERAQNNRQLAALNAVAAALNRFSDPEEMAQAALDQILAVLSLQAGAIITWPKTGEEEGPWRLFRGPSASVVQEMNELCRENGRLWEQLLHSEKPWAVKDITLEPWLHDAAQEKKNSTALRSLACVSLTARAERQLGVLVVGATVPDRFLAQDIESLVLIGNQMGLALENVRLSRAERRRAEQLAVLAQMGSHLVSTSSIERLPQEIVNSIKRIFGSLRVTIVLIEDGVVLHQAGDYERWASLEEAERAALVRHAMDADGHFFWGEELIAPLKVGSKFIGLLAVALPSRIGEAQRLLPSLASQIAVAIDNARLFQLSLHQSTLLKQRADRLAEVMATSDRLLSLSTRLDRLLDEIAHIVHESLGFGLVAVAVIDKKGHTLQAKVLADIEDETARENFLNTVYAWEPLQRFMRPQNRIGRSYFIRYQDYFPTDQPPPSSGEGKWQEGDILLVPIERGDRQRVGLLAVDRPHDGAAPGLETVHALELFANQTAIVLDNARLFEALERRLEETNTLFRVGQSVVTSLDLDEVLNLIVDAALKTITPAQKVIIHLLDESRELLVPRAVSHRAEPVPSAQMRVGKKGIAGFAVANKRAIYVPDTSREARFVDIGTNLKSLLVVPLVLGETVIGTLSVDSTEIDAFDLNDKRLLTMLANYAAIAIENARLYGEAKRADELAILNKISAAMTATLDLEQVMAAAMQGIDKALRMEAGCLLLLDEKQGKLVTRMNVRHGERREADFSLALGQGLAGWVVQENKPLLVHDVRGETRFHPALNQALDVITRSALCVPLVLRDKAVGAIEVVNKLEGHFTEDDLTLLSSIAASLAIAIDNARLYTEIKGFAEELARSQAQLVQSAKLAATGKLAASIAHEINNPLQAVQSCIYLVADGIGDADPDKQYLDIAREELDRISKIVGRMVDFYRPSEGERKPTEVNSLLKNILTLMGKQVQQSQVTVNTNLPSNLPLIMATADHLKQVFFNMILNALEAMPEGGELYVATRPVRSRVETIGGEKEEDFVQLEFTDTGVGIAPELMDNIFDPFYTTKTKGTGLGLSISYDIIERHGGQMKVESTVGKGTTFLINLPVVEAG